MIIKTKILIEGYCHIPSYDMIVQSFHRFCNIIPIDIRCKLSRNIKIDDINWCDILLIVRGDNPLSAYLADTAKRAGRIVILFIDDDLVAVRSDIVSFENKYCRKCLLKVIDNVDHILTCSSYLGEKYKKIYGLNFTQIHTDINRSQISHIPHTVDNGHIKLIYAASRGHKVFFEDLIKPILNRLYEKYLDKVSFTIIGPEVDTENIMIDIENIRSMPLEDYRKYMNENKFDIGIAPLYDTEICRSKYFNKYFEYTINGICGIYSDVIPYNLAVINGKNGYLVRNTPDDWYNAICKAIDNIEQSAKIATMAQEDVLSKYSSETIALKLYRNLDCFLSNKSNILERYKCDNMYLKYFIKAIYRNILKCIDRYRQQGFRYVVREITYKLKKCVLLQKSKITAYDKY